MGGSSGKNGRLKTGKESRYPESGGKRRLGRQIMRWEDCGIWKESERKWRTTAKDRRRGRLLIENEMENLERKDKDKDDGSHGQPHT